MLLNNKLQTVTRLKSLYHAEVTLSEWYLKNAVPLLSSVRLWRRLCWQSTYWSGRCFRRFKYILFVQVLLIPIEWSMLCAP